MSTLTSAECNAGISRRALETMTRHNLRKTSHEVISAFKATAVIDTPMRKLEVMESQDGEVIIRDTEYIKASALVTMTHLNYHEAHALAEVLRDLEPMPEPTNGNGKEKARA